MDNLIVRLKGHLAKNPKVRLALLFGSYATGKANESSDLDLAVAYQQPLELDERIDLAQDISALLNKEIDLIDLRAASGVLLQQIIANRKTLVNHDPELYGNFIAKQVTEAADFMPLYDAILRAKRDRFINGQKGS